MRIKTIHLREFKRFQDLTIEDLPSTTRLVVLVGPNGSGKSCLFDAFRLWLGVRGVSNPWDQAYHLKQGVTPKGPQQLVDIEFHQPEPQDADERKKLFYIRSAYRNEADFTASDIRRMGSILDAPRVPRLIDNDVTVMDNYKRLVSSAIETVYGGDVDDLTVRDLKERSIGQLRESLASVFEDLLLTGPGNPMAGGTFLFQKGTSRDFLYKNLSGGEKAAFDLLLDLIAKLPSYNATVFCIDEPDLHMHTRLQGRLLGELFDLVPPDCQLWIATHSIGMMRKAMELHSEDPESVVFLDFQNMDFDSAERLVPVTVDRSFWTRTLSVALDDLAGLVAPKQVVLCEGGPAASSDPGRAEFDARCYRSIFSREYPETDFVSIGNDQDVCSDRLQIGKAIQTIVSGTKVIRLVDRDSRTSQEIADLDKRGIRVLTRRNLEGYLLDDEVLVTFCKSVDRAWQADPLIEEKRKALAASEARGNAPDDLKSVAGDVYVAARTILNLPQLGNSAHAFMRDTLAPLVVPRMEVYRILKQDIFGE